MIITCIYIIMLSICVVLSLLVNNSFEFYIGAEEKCIYQHWITNVDVSKIHVSCKYLCKYDY